MLPRFFVPGAGSGETVSLSGEEAHHAARVLRLRPGDEIAVFDGRGGEWRARLEAVAPRAVRARLLARSTPAPELPFPVTLVQAVLKGDRMDDLVRDATMLGVAAIQPVVSERTVARGVAERARARWCRVAIASARQCGRAVVPEIAPVADLADYLRRGAPAREASLILLVEPGAGGGLPLARFRDRRPISALVLAAGPEGGWTPAEIAAARGAGFEPLTLGRLTLRADAAAVVALAALLGVWDAC
jgi:16S rRNA (uracil1498-N3)-methyltransferase